MRPLSSAVVVSLVCLGTQAIGQTVENCEWQAAARYLVEPWGQNTATFANGKVRLALLDTVEPAAGGFHVLVLSPPYNEIGDRQCRTVGMQPGIGFSGVDFESLSSSYSPETGLRFELNVRRYVPEEDLFAPGVLMMTVNQSTGSIGVQLR